MSAQLADLKQQGNVIVRLAEQDLPQAEQRAKAWLLAGKAAQQSLWIAVDLMSRADAALYRAKGRNCVRFQP